MIISLREKRRIGVDFRHCLIGSIKGLADESKRVRSKLHICHSDVGKNELADSRRFIGNRSRHNLLAYAFLRHVPYSLVEKKCRDDNKPDPKLIHEIVSMHTNKYLLNYEIYSLDAVKNWLEGK